MNNRIDLVNDMTQKEQSCCFTGHRKLPEEQIPFLAEKVRQEILRLVQLGVTHFYAGGALGFDTLAAQTVLAVKRNNPSVCLHLILPCQNQTQYWSERDRRVYQTVRAGSDSEEYVSESYTPWCMHERNRRLTAESRYCICYLVSEKGGTAYTVGYAKKKGLTVINLADDDSQITFF